MSTILNYLLTFIDIIKDNYQTVRDNWLLFLLWTIACVMIVIAIYESIRKKDKKRIKADEKEIARLKASFNELNVDPWLNASDSPPPNYAAEDISDSLKH